MAVAWPIHAVRAEPGEAHDPARPLELVTIVAVLPGRSAPARSYTHFL